MGQKCLTVGCGRLLQHCRRGGRGLDFAFVQICWQLGGGEHSGGIADLRPSQLQIGRIVLDDRQIERTPRRPILNDTIILGLISGIEI